MHVYTQCAGMRICKAGGGGRPLALRPTDSKVVSFVAAGNPEAAGVPLPSMNIFSARWRKESSEKSPDRLSGPSAASSAGGWKSCSGEEQLSSGTAAGAGEA